MHSIRIIGPGRAGTSLAAALSARGWAFAGFLGRHDDLAGAAARRRRARHRHPRRRHRRGGGRRRARRHAPPSSTSRARSGSTRWRPTRCGPPCTRSCRCPTARSARPGCARASPSPWPGARWPATMVAAPRAAAWSRSPTATGPPTTPPPASRPTTWWRCSARSSGSPPRSASTSSPSCPLTRAAVDDVAALGAGAALTGPARRGDWATLSRHLDALPESERAGYQAGCRPGHPARRSRRPPTAEPSAAARRSDGPCRRR